MARVFIVLTTGTTWYAPADCRSIKVECLSGGTIPNYSQSYYVEGSYSQSTNITVTPFQKYFYQIGTPGGQTWFNTENSIPVVGTQNSTNSCLAFQTISGASESQIQSDQITKSIGDYKYFGGISSLSYTYCFCNGDSSIYSAGGGGAGPNGNGGSSNPTFRTGGGANGGTSAVGSVAGAGPLGNTDGTNGAPVNVLAQPLTNSEYIIWTDQGKNSYGIGSGFSTALGFSNPTINFIGYGSTNRSGLIVISYVPVGLETNSYTEVYPGPVSSFNWQVPSGVTTIKVEALGAGGGSYGGVALKAGGGGAYASNTISVSAGQIFRVNVGVSSFEGSNTTFIRASDNVPIVNAGSGSGGSSGTGAGGIVYVGTGYPGGNGAPSYGTTNANYRGGGGGGAGGPDGPGGDGGLPYGTTTGTSGGGGGAGGAGLVGSPVTLSPTSLAANGSLFFTIPSGKTIIPGTTITVSGTFGSGGLTGYTNPTNYYVRSTNGTSTANLCSTYLATIITATATTNFGSAVFTISNRGGVGGLTGSGQSANFGGAGGSGAFRDVGGAAGRTTASGAVGINGSGGGGGGLNASFSNGANSSNAQIYSTTQSNTAIGFFLGSGGGGAAGSSSIGGLGGVAFYGGGAGMSSYTSSVIPGGAGLIAITYTVAANTNASESSMSSMF